MEISGDHKIILFDGVCNFCNSTINFVIQRDQKDIFRFASLQSELGSKLLQERHIDPSVTDSIVLIVPGSAYYIKSQAALEIASELGGPWKVMSWMKHAIPTPLADRIYDFIAARRYSWFGKKDHCMLPSPEVRAKFLDQVELNQV